MTNKLETLRELVAAGDRATQGEWNAVEITTGGDRPVRKISVGSGSDLCKAYIANLGKPAMNNADFFAKAANARPALKALLAVAEAAKESRNESATEQARLEATVRLDALLEETDKE